MTLIINIVFMIFRIVSGPTHTNLIFDVLLPTGDQIAHTDLKQAIEKKVKELSPTYFLCYSN